MALYKFKTLISKILIAWYRKHKRNLPWRNTQNPYHIWLSEIILQQTQVVQGLPYFNRFVENFPTIKDLALAKEDEVLKLWQGLGYYSRARNLHFSAQFVHHKLGGKFPNTFKDIKQLKGVGDYTAAAVASFCFNERVPVLDGNVIRLISRYYGIDAPVDSSKTIAEIRSICETLIAEVNPAEFNQAIMEFGSLQCKPSNPNCNECPLKESCWAFNNNKVAAIPYKAKKTKKRNRFFYYLYISNKQFTFIKKRDENDIWKGLYEFPLIEHEEKLSDELLHKKLNDLGLAFVEKSNYTKHLLSHQNLYACSIACSLKNKQSKEKVDASFAALIQVNKNDLEQYAFPKLLEKLMNNFTN
jgi:A/G-specific adenine glycosylase